MTLLLLLNRRHCAVTIVGGEEASPGAWPWQIYLQTFDSDGKEYLCGGSLITNQWVLTATHFLPTISKLHLHGREVNRNVIQVELHPDYNTGGSFDHDIALLKMSSPVTFTNYIQPVCLADKTSTLNNGLSMWVSGWGRLTEGGNISNTLQEVCVPLVADTECQSLFRFTLPHPTICAGYPEGGKSICSGDSGGALVVKQGSVWVQVGIVSASVGCARPNLPALYAEVPAFQDWIQSKMGQNDSPGFRPLLQLQPPTTNYYSAPYYDYYSAPYTTTYYTPPTTTTTAPPILRLLHAPMTTTTTAPQLRLLQRPL
uniref:Peptidase S1 domain-containing protein n=1 Tax=Neogobius melanostomus TaxID=47308 RepID=A0A8C6UE93_9GOBI